MKIAIEISAEHYSRFLAGLSQESRARAVLKKAVMLEHPQHKGRRIVKIICEKSDAELLLRIAQEVCQEAVPEIEKSIARGIVFA
jgi:hypothetical protein